MKTPEEFFKSRLQKPDKDNYYHIPADLLHEYMKSFASQSQPNKAKWIQVFDNEKGDITLVINARIVGYIKSKLTAIKLQELLNGLNNFASQSQPNKEQIVEVLVKNARWSEEHGHDVIFDILFQKVAKEILALSTPITNNYNISNTEGNLHNIADPDYPKSHE